MISAEFDGCRDEKKRPQFRRRVIMGAIFVGVHPDGSDEHQRGWRLAIGTEPSFDWIIINNRRLPCDAGDAGRPAAVSSGSASAPQ